MADPYSGFRALGEMVTGKIGTPGVYEDTLKKAYSTEEQLQQARRARALALIDSGRLDARQTVTPDLIRAALGGDIAAQAELGAGVLGGNQTMNLGQLGDFQRPHYGQNINAAQEALGSGDIGGYNKFNAAAEGKSYQPVRVLGNAFVEDGVTLGDLDAIPTPEALSRIEQNEAQAKAALIRANKPPAPRSSGGKPKSAAAVEAEVVAQARDRIAGGADPKKVAEYLRSKGYPGAAKKIAP